MNYSTAIATLRPKERTTIDPACLALLRDAHAPGQADNTMAEALEDLALGLSRTANAYRQDRFADLARECIAIGQIAGRIGLDRMARVAMTSAALAQGEDAVALGANLARLMRMGNDALSAIWDHQDRIG